MKYEVKSSNMTLTNGGITNVTYNTNVYTNPKLLSITENENSIEVTYSTEYLVSDFNGISKPEIFKVVYGRFDGSKKEIYGH
jgi:hypothetical protein